MDGPFPQTFAASVTKTVSKQKPTPRLSIKMKSLISNIFVASFVVLVVLVVLRATSAQILVNPGVPSNAQLGCCRSDFPGNYLSAI